MPNHGLDEETSKNGLGLAGFIFSCLGFFSCGLFSVPGFVLSFFGVFKQPRTLALIGLILALPGTIFFATVGIGILVLFIGAGGMAIGFGHLFSLQAAFADASTKVRAAYVENSDVTTKDLQVAVKGVEDPWDRQIFVSRTGKSFVLVSGGEDKKVGTEDDITREFDF